MNLSEGQAYENIVCVGADQAPALFRVSPGQPDSSYLVHKIQGTHGSVGGSGERMPLGGGPLPQAAIEVVRRWIAEGAPNN